MTSPNPNWKPGSRIQAPFSALQTLDVSKMERADVYKFIIGSIVPRPIAFVSTCSQSGSVNLAPFSFFNGVSSKPPCLVFSVARKPDGTEKDTLRNIREVAEFVINSANEWLIEPLVHCSGEFPYGVDELVQAGLTPLKSDLIRPPRVAEAAVQMECKIEKLVDIGDGGVGSATLVVGQILRIHVAKEIYRDGKIDLQAFKPVARLGGFRYAQLGKIFELIPPEVG